MKIHRFYLDAELPRNLWVEDDRLVNQWLKVLRFQVGSQLVLFDGVRQERLYEISKIGNQAVHLELITELVRQVPKSEVYLFFSLLKKDKNDWVLQKCTELGVSHFVPMLTERTEKTGFDIERAQKIVIEAAEQCGRSDIPRLREPITPETALKEFEGKITMFFAEQADSEPSPIQPSVAAGIMIGPEGGWTDTEKQDLASVAQKINLSQFTLRAETACVVAAAKLLQ